LVTISIFGVFNQTWDIIEQMFDQFNNVCSFSMFLQPTPQGRDGGLEVAYPLLVPDIQAQSSTGATDFYLVKIIFIV
jgi:hypothetical protein